MSINRRRLLIGAMSAGAASLLHYPADAAEFVYKLGHDEPVTHPQHIRVVEAAKKIAEETSNRLMVQVYPNSQLGSDTQMLAQARSGALELVLMADLIVGNVVPVASLAGLPFAFNGYSDLWAAMDGKFGSYIHSEIEKKTGLHVFEKGWDAGFRDVFTAEHPIHNAGDMKGLKLRIPAVTLDQSLFKALGSAPTPVPSGDVYTALQTHLVDGAEDPLITIESSKYYEASKYISLTKHQPTPFEMLANGAAWRRLPKKLQDVLSDNLNETGLVERKDIVKGEDKLRELLKTQGQTFIEPDRESFRDVVRKAGLYSQWRDGYGGPVPFGLLEQIVGKLV